MSEEFILTNENYYTDEANKRYMSVHTYYEFAGNMGHKACEARAMAKLNGTYKEDDNTTPLLVGGYVDAYFEGTLEKFKEEHPDCFTQKGELKAAFKQAEKMIARCEQDKYFMKFMSGVKQKIFTGSLYGCEWKCKLDSYLPGIAIVDLKTSADIHKAWRVADYGYATFVEYWGYITQMAVYQKLVDINTGEKLPCYIAVVTKEDSPEIEIIHIDQDSLDFALEEVRQNMPNVLAVRDGEVEPTSCGTCDYCKAKKKLMKPISYRDLINTEI